MESTSFIIFSLNDSYYGIESLAVQEVFYLPDLTPITEAFDDIVGVLNLRGEILPVIDLHLRLGHGLQEYHLSDSLVVLSWQNTRVGIIVNQVHEVQSILNSEIKTDISSGRNLPQASSFTGRFVTGIAQVETNLVILLNHQALIRGSLSIETESTLLNESYQEASSLPNQTSFSNPKRDLRFWPNATPEERTILRQRAENLRHATDTEESKGLIPLAVIGLNGEFFGLDLDAVREFTDIDKITPVPCCPSHIVGNINLRGEIVTLVDIRGLLNLPIVKATQGSKAMIVRLNDLVAGVTVDEVFDVMYLNSLEIKPVPAAVHSMNDEYLRGTAPYGKKMMGILELPKILMQGRLIVDEEV